MANKNTNQGVTLKKWQLILIIVIVVVLVAGGIIVGMNWNKWFGKGIDKADISSSTTESVGADIDPNALDYDAGSLADKTGDSGVSEGIQIPGYPSINLPANTKNIQLVLLNPKGNPCYFTFKIVLKDTDEVIYTSKQVPPGKAIQDLELTRGLEAGTYDAVIQITTNSLEDQSAMNGANVETQLIVS